MYEHQGFMKWFISIIKTERENKESGFAFVCTAMNKHLCSIVGSRPSLPHEHTHSSPTDCVHNDKLVLLTQKPSAFHFPDARRA